MSQHNVDFDPKNPAIILSFSKTSECAVGTGPRFILPPPCGATDATERQGYIALTKPVMNQHTSYQDSIHHDPAYVRGERYRKSCGLDIAVDGLGVEIGPPLRYQIAHNTVGMKPAERFDVDGSYPQARYSGYQPVSALTRSGRGDDWPAQHTPPRNTFSNPTSPYASCATSNNHPYFKFEDRPYYIPQTPGYPALPATNPSHDMAEWGYDLAGVGTSFDPRIRSPDEYVPNSSRGGRSRTQGC